MEHFVTKVNSCKSLLLLERAQSNIYIYIIVRALRGEGGLGEVGLAFRNTKV